MALYSINHLRVRPWSRNSKETAAVAAVRMQGEAPAQHGRNSPSGAALGACIFLAAKTRLLSRPVQKPKLALWVIYENPKDFPGQLVVRRWLGMVPDKIPLAVINDLRIARSVIPDWCIPIGTYPDEDPAIKEVWI